jgi:hypothetical protein
MPALEISALDQRAPLKQQILENRSMASALICAVAPDGEVSPMRKRSQEIEDLAHVGLAHLSPIFPLKHSPGGLVAGGLALFEQILAGSQVW